MTIKHLVLKKISSFNDFNFKEKNFKTFFEVENGQNFKFLNMVWNGFVSLPA